MPACLHPLTGWKTRDGQALLGNREPPNAAYRLAIPCAGCVHCRQNHAFSWALRCQLELQRHDCASFVTLTYDDAHLPDTLVKRDLQLWLKRLRSALQRGLTPDRTIRFFACGEYGETNGRPHYHAILFGLDATEDHLVDEAWNTTNATTGGITRTFPANARTIAYTAGYTAKKREPKFRLAHHDRPRLDRTGTYFYRHQNPFFQMSRGGRGANGQQLGGLGSNAKQWPESWRLYAIQNGFKKPVPRYLHQAWLAQATPLQLEDLEQEKYELSLTRHTTPEQQRAQEKITLAKHSINAAKKLL